MGTTNNTERASAGAGTTACPCGAETSGAEGSRTRGYTALQVLDLLNAQQVALLAGAEKRAARLRDAVFAAGKSAGAPEGLDAAATAEWLGRAAARSTVRRLWGEQMVTPADGFPSTGTGRVPDTKPAAPAREKVARRRSKVKGGAA